MKNGVVGISSTSDIPRIFKHQSKKTQLFTVLDYRATKLNVQFVPALTASGLLFDTYFFVLPRSALIKSWVAVVAVVVVGVVVFTFNRFLCTYPTTSLVHPVFVLLFHPREMQIMWSRQFLCSRIGGSKTTVFDRRLNRAFLCSRNGAFSIPTFSIEKADPHIPSKMQLTCIVLNLKYLVVGS